MPQDGESSKCLEFVNRYDTKPKRRLFEMLKSQGMQLNQTVTFLSDGGDTRSPNVPESAGLTFR